MADSFLSPHHFSDCDGAYPGRQNEYCLDFDTLWYGVRSEYVLDNGSGIYENPGMVGMAYVYAKGLETLTLPCAIWPATAIFCILTCGWQP